MVVSLVTHLYPMSSLLTDWLSHLLAAPRSRADRRSEYGKFILDATRLVEEISANQTFHSVSPLLNFWAAFTPSEEVRSYSR